MISLFLVLLTIMGTVNVLNYRDIVTQADNTLALLQENGGSFPQKGDGPPPGRPGAYGYISGTSL